MGNLVFQATLGGQVNLVGPNTASTYNINVPSVNGNLVTTGDTGTVTSTMLAGSIANAKLTNSSVTVGSTSIALGATSTTLDREYRCYNRWNWCVYYFEWVNLCHYAYRKKCKFINFAKQWNYYGSNY
jgi:hypothetical protein